jgi:hypothetical protein
MRKGAEPSGKDCRTVFLFDSRPFLTRGGPYQAGLPPFAAHLSRFSL